MPEPCLRRRCARRPPTRRNRRSRPSPRRRRRRRCSGRPHVRCCQADVSPPLLPPTPAASDFTYRPLLGSFPLQRCSGRRWLCFRTCASWRSSWPSLINRASSAAQRFGLMAPGSFWLLRSSPAYAERGNRQVKSPSDICAYGRSRAQFPRVKKKAQFSVYNCTLLCVSYIF
jgi:hypothetical protein